MQAQTWRDDALELQFHVLDELLRQHEHWWRPQAFTFTQMPWESAHPQLSHCLRNLSLQQSEHFAENENALTEFMREFIPAAIKISSACAVPNLEPLRALPPMTTARDVPGRKWQQINAFAERLQPDTQSALEWCAGKAHLGQLLARSGVHTVTALEWSAELIATGEFLTQRDNLALQFAQVDVMSAQAVAHIFPEHSVVALHACGDLHTQLLHACAERKPAALLLAPCCYHLTHNIIYQPLSRCGLHGGLTLSRDDLRTAVQGSVTAPARVQQQRKQLQAWRLGFDLLQRELRGSDAYLPTPSFPASVLRAGFPAFCQSLARRKGLQLPLGLDYQRYEAAGVERLRLVAALDLPRLLFRRALELWLVLDRALFLRESGYAVEVGTFCTRTLTPRNLLIRASLRSAAA